MYIACCDNCKEPYEGFNDQSAYAMESELKEALTEDEWQTEGDRHYCNTCAIRDSHGILIINNSRFIQE